MTSSTSSTQRLLRHTLTVAMVACFAVAGWLLLKPLLHPATAEAATGSAKPWTTKAIEDVKVGDLILARDEHGTEIGWKPVKEVYRRTSYHLRHLTFRDAAGQEQLFETTDEHPFWSITAKKFVNAGDLAIGDRVTSAVPGQGRPDLDDAAAIQTLTSTQRDDHPDGITVYNFQVEDFHTYFVAARGATGPPVLVHNADYDDLDDLGSIVPKGKPDNLKSTDALRAHNNSVRSLSKQYGLTKSQQRQLHDEITGQDYTREEIEGIIQSMFGAGN